MTASILPPAETQFLDNDGVPLAGGKLYTYVPGTTTPKTTWQDSAETIANTNPIILDAAGRCICWGSGAYRTILLDSLDNEIFDQLTDDGPVSAAMLPIVEAATIPLAEGLWERGITSGSAPPGPLLGQRWIDNSDPAAVVLSVYDGAQWMMEATWDTTHHVWINNGAAELTALPIVDTQPIGQSGTHAFVVSDVTSVTTKALPAEFGFSVNFTNQTGKGASVALSGNKVGIYSAVETTSTGGNAWAMNAVLLIDIGGGALGGQQICEWDIANNSGTHYGDGLGFTGIVQPAAFGHQITGNGTNRVTAGMVILGTLTGALTPLWNNGIVGGVLAIRQNFLADYSSSTRSYLLSGAHDYGIDMAGQTGEGANPALPAIIAKSAVRLGSQHKVSWRNAADSADLNMLQSTSSDGLTVGTSAANVNLYPLALLMTGIFGSTTYANDAAAAAGGVALGQMYRNGSVLQIRMV